MKIEAVINGLINDGVIRVWFYQATDSGGAKAFQLLDEHGGELAWRWVSDGPLRWRTGLSSLPCHTQRPDCGPAYDLTENRLELIIRDAGNGSAMSSRPDWCR